MTLDEICALAPVIPVLTIEDAVDAVPLGEALVAGGLPVLEVTLRTPAALEAIARIRSEVAGAVVGAGTLRSAQDVHKAAKVGAMFGVSPGFSPAVMATAAKAGLPMLPGVATPSEAMAAAELGCEILKFFPAEANGGIPVLKAWAAPLAGLKFCPTGGIDAANAADYLALPTVVCVGGSWVAPKAMVTAGDWGGIEALAHDAASLGL
ncbi:MAG: bifunctional 4-hydroxy-2-oxoglutarate aldolase/2-dehydro-3-deoxy-phosphogluconate aldolase [Pseudomonadota bacterium]